MAYNLLSCQREQGYLMPPSLREWLPEEDLVWFILDTVEQLELEEFYVQYRDDSWGAAPYDSAMMVKVLVYAYCVGVPSSRQMEKRLHEDTRDLQIVNSRTGRSADKPPSAPDTTWAGTPREISGSLPHLPVRHAKKQPNPHL